jgi:nucleotide-binding universal stress UspA family protein
MHIEKEESENTKTKTTTSIIEPTSRIQTFTNPQYNRILIAHDGSESSNKALDHAIYLSKMSGAEILILHVLENIHDMDSSAVLATSRGEGEREGTKAREDIENLNKQQNYEIRVEGEVKEMIEEKIRFCKQAGVKSQVSYKIQPGKPADKIVKVAEETSIDLIVMASSKSSRSLARRILGSTSRKVIDSVEKPVLIIHG